VDHLAYLTKQQVAIAEQTAAWKTAELLVKTATLKRNLARRLAKGAAGAAKRRMLIRQQTVNRQTVELAAAGVNP
ncbi:MAG: OmpA family protein, partial [Methylobacter sp.]